jgi:WXXGXW repeat (2 copies)
MNRRKWINAVLASGVLICLALPACVVVPDQRHYADGAVMVAPPPLRDEVIGIAPATGYVWFGGYWSWVGGRYEWVAGHWAPGRPGYHWVTQQWVRQGDGWRMRSGRWERG